MTKDRKRAASQDAVMHVISTVFLMHPHRMMGCLLLTSGEAFRYERRSILDSDRPPLVRLTVALENGSRNAMQRNPALETSWDLITADLGKD